MAILSFLSAGLLFSLSFFQSEYERAQKTRAEGEGDGVQGSAGNAAPKDGEKTD